MRGLLLLVLVGAGSAHAQTPVPGPPVSRLAGMIREGPYELMLRYRDETFHPIEQHGASAVQRGTLIDATTVVTYLFVLSRQDGSPCQGCCPNCWMTDGVYIDTVGGRMT